MATDPKPRPSWIGARLATIREQKRLTAAQLADRIPGSQVTKTVITNVESGRKRDLTATELVQIASALDVSPLALLVDVDAPWEPVAVAGLAKRHAGLTNIEYARRATIFGPDGVRAGGFNRDSSGFVESIIAAEVALDARKFYDNEPDSADSNSSWTLTTPQGEEHWVHGGKYKDDETWWELTQTVVDRYRAAANALAMSRRFGSSTGLRPSGPIEERFEGLRRTVIAMLREHPDLEYGQSEAGHWYTRSLPIDPRTGQVVDSLDPRPGEPPLPGGT